MLCNDKEENAIRKDRERKKVDCQDDVDLRDGGLTHLPG
jgi:hypothetical protein